MANEGLTAFDNFSTQINKEISESVKFTSTEAANLSNYAAIAGWSDQDISNLMQVSMSLFAK